MKFFGRGSGFTCEHTSAYFTTKDKEIIIIDCPVSTFQKLRDVNLDNYDDCYVLITHTHGDHIGGLGLFVQYVFFTLERSVTIVAPSNAVANDILTLLTIEGNDTSWYKLVTTSDIAEKVWFKSSILTKHSPLLENKCFGYNLIIDNTNVVYTGDTSTLKPFLPYLTDYSVLYVDTSVYYVMIHLKLEDSLSELVSFTSRHIKVYLMHLDDVNAAKN